MNSGEYKIYIKVVVKNIYTFILMTFSSEAVLIHNIVDTIFRSTFVDRNIVLIILVSFK